MPAQALAVLYANVTHAVTLTDKGIARIADMKGKTISTGAAGSGTEVIAFRVLEAAGLNPQSDVQKQALGAAESVNALKDGKIDAFFWSGGLPTAAVLDLANTPRMQIRMLPNDDILPALQKQYGAGLYYRITVPGPPTPGWTPTSPWSAWPTCWWWTRRCPRAWPTTSPGCSSRSRPSWPPIHPEAKNLTLDRAIEGSPVPFHKGAIRLYRERKVES